MLNAYLQSIKTTKTRNPSEHAYRSSLKHILNDLSMIDEPSNKGRNKIDMEVYTKEGLVSFYIETKMLGFDLGANQYQKQFERYKKDFQKLIITNFVDFEFYRDGELVGKCTVADKDTLTENETGYETFKNLLDSFMLDCVKFSNPILLAKKLAEKTRTLKNKILENLNSDELEVRELKDSGRPITKKYKVLAYRDEFKKVLLEDVDNDSFSDLYAQTITYGLFASRYYAFQKDATAVFTKSQAADFIPTTNPLLKQLFESITLDSKSSDFDKGINLVIDDITKILANTNMAMIIERLREKKNDIVIHFYETFLEHYDKELRKSMGVWYTPTEVVDYVVKGVDSLLKTKFDILKGISSDEKQDYTFSKNVRKPDGSIKTEKITKKGVHRVQVLDPAVGTGNFLNATINHIKTKFDMPSFWKDYVNQDLIPRLNGFELMMPSYVMAHMKMYELLKDDLDSNSKRFNVFLTNTLYGNIEIEQTLLSSSDLIYQLNEEVNGANRVRKEQPVMVVMGNPPYNGNSKNNGAFISNLMSDYYPEENIGKGLNDDYIKFIRYGQHLIDQNANGILAYVSNNSFIHSIACSKMRRSLLKSFDEIYVLNLHGDKDDNVFNIKTPISITFFVKTNKKDADELGKVFYHEIKGTKKLKIDYCKAGEIDGNFKLVEFGSDDCFFYPQDVNLADTYNDLNTTFDLDQLFESKTVGVLTQCDTLVLDTNADRLVRKISAYRENNVLPDSPSDHLKGFDHKKLAGNFEDGDGQKNMLEYRPFDDRFFFDSNVVARSKKKLNAHADIEGNVFFNFTHTCLDDDFRHVLFTEKTPECKLFKGARSTHTAPLFVYVEAPKRSENGVLFSSSKTKSNINQLVFGQFQTISENVSPLDVLDYVYGVLNDTDYVKRYNELLKSNYPRVPYPKTKDELDQFAEKGARLRQVHLEKKKIDTLSTYQAVVNNAIEKVEYDEANQRLWFNNDSYFDHITKEMWEYKIGAVNPLASWLESRCKTKDVFDRPMVGVYLNVIYRVRNSI